MNVHVVVFKDACSEMINIYHVTKQKREMCKTKKEGTKSKPNKTREKEITHKYVANIYPQKISVYVNGIFTLVT